MGRVVRGFMGKMRVLPMEGIGLCLWGLTTRALHRVLHWGFADPGDVWKIPTSPGKTKAKKPPLKRCDKEKRKLT